MSGASAFTREKGEDGVLVLTLGGDTLGTSYGANCTAVAGQDGTLLVDPLVCPAHARLVAGAILELWFWVRAMRGSRRAASAVPRAKA